MQKWEELAVITEICKAAEKYSPGMNGKGFMKSCRSSDGSQRPRSKLTEHQTCNAASCGVFDPRGSRHTTESRLSVVMNGHASMSAWLVARGNKNSLQEQI